MTADGARCLEAELAVIRDVEPKRAADIQRILASATIVQPSTELPEEVLFGTAVEVRDAEGEARTFWVVGVDEIGNDSSYVSWMSPIGKSLLGAVAGQRVMLDIGGEAKAFTIVRINH